MAPAKQRHHTDYLLSHLADRGGWHVDAVRNNDAAHAACSIGSSVEFH
jgi:hypothetical protein